MQDSTSDAISRGSTGHRRTGSTLKSVMRKIFSRGRRSQTGSFEEGTVHLHSSVRSQGAPTPEPILDGDHHLGPHSMGSNANSPLLKEDEPNLSDSRRSPIALGDVPVAPGAMPSRPRRATLPSLVFLGEETREVYAATQPAKTGQNPDGNAEVNSNKDERQRRNILQAKRRSRSANTLRGLAKYHRMSPIQWRRRSVELHGNHWKSSALETASVSDQSLRPGTMTSAASEPELTQSSISEAVPEPGPESSIRFNAGDLISSMQHDDDVTIEQRLTTLEVKLIDLELAIARMQSHNPKSSSVDRLHSKQPSPPGLVTHQHKRNKSSGSAESETFHASHREEDRPLSTSTIRPNNVHHPPRLKAPSVSSFNEASPVSVEQYSALVMLLRREQSARRNLESQLASMQEDIRQLQGVAHNSMSIGTRYPIQSIHSHEYLRFQHTMDHSPTGSPASAQEKIGLGPIYDSTSDSELDFGSRDDGHAFEPHGWHHDTRIEIAGMI